MLTKVYQAPTHMIRMSKLKYEQGLIGDIKSNPNLYHGHCRRTLKTKQGVSNVIGPDGTLTETEEEVADALNAFYHSVFTVDEEQADPPVIEAQTEKNCGTS